MITIAQLDYLQRVYEAGEWNDLYTARLLRECRKAIQQEVLTNETIGAPEPMRCDPACPHLGFPNDGTDCAVCESDFRRQQDEARGVHVSKPLEFYDDPPPTEPEPTCEEECKRTGCLTSNPKDCASRIPRHNESESTSDQLESADDAQRTIGR